MKTRLVNPNFSSNYVENLLKFRGIENLEQYKHPTAECLQDPSALKNIGTAAALYLRVVLNGGRILLVVDSDQDGYTSAAIIYQYTKQVNCHCQIDYWLHTGKQHGLSDHIDRLLASDTHYDLVLLPDSSSNDATYHNMLDGLNLPCLILDHHLTDVALSDNAVVVNNQLSPDYRNKANCGAGVTFQFCRYIDQKIGQHWADEYIDLAALGNIGDMGSMIDMENRYIAYEGLRNVKNKFFRELCEKQAYSITGKMGANWKDIQAKLNPISIAFYITPLVNAVIRVGTAEEKDLLFRAFLDGDEMVPCNKRGAKGTMEKASIEMARICTNARSHQNKQLDTFMSKVDMKISKYDLLSNKLLIILLDETDTLPPEINGLLAMRCAAKYKKPTLVLREGPDGHDKGSGRNVNNGPLESLKDFLSQSGIVDFAQGHAGAFGTSLPHASIGHLHAYANEHLADLDFGEDCYDINFERVISEKDLGSLIAELSAADGIWGQDNNQPLICITGIPCTSTNITVMGSDKSTTKIFSNGIAFMKFKDTNFIDELAMYNNTCTLNIVGRANMNAWNGTKTPQIFIDSYEIMPATKTNIYEF